MSPRRAAAPDSPAPAPSGGSRWLLFVHQLPAQDSNLRVRTWRRLQQLGALAVKQAVYVLPDSPAARESFEWLKTDVVDAGGQATIFSADGVDAWSDDAIVEEFRRTRQQAYAELAAELDEALTRATVARAKRRRPLTRRMLDAFRQRFANIEQIDFFDSAGRDRVTALLAQCDTHLTPRKSHAPKDDSPAGDLRGRYRRRLWVTRPRPGVDRMACAWLIRRFIDTEARFAFADDRQALDADAVSFDMYGGTFTHRHDHCTFEVLCLDFALAEAGLDQLAALVHELDLGGGHHDASDAATVGKIIQGLQLAHTDDDELLAHGMVLFDALFQAARHAARPPRPRAVAVRRPSRKKQS